MEADQRLKKNEYMREYSKGDEVKERKKIYQAEYTKRSLVIISRREYQREYKKRFNVIINRRKTNEKYYLKKNGLEPDEPPKIICRFCNKEQMTFGICSCGKANNNNMWDKNKRRALTKNRLPQSL